MEGVGGWTSFHKYDILCGQVIMKAQPLWVLLAIILSPNPKLEYVCLWRHLLGRTLLVTNKKKIFVSKKLQYSKMFVILGEH